MVRFFIYLLIFGVILYLISSWKRRLSQSTGDSPLMTKPKSLFKFFKDPQEPWTQVYETETLEEARILQARLQEQEIDCIVYEQGKKDIHGNALKGVGVAVPRSVMRLAQEIISKASF